MPRYEKRSSTLAERIAVFETSLRDGGYGDAIERWPAYVNRDVLTVYETAEADILDRDGFLSAYWRERSWVGTRDEAPNWTAHRNAGNAIHWAIRLGILFEEVRDGVRVWRLVSREPIWGLDRSRPGARLYRLQGGTPAEQAEQARLAKRNATREKLRATLAAKACAEAVPAIGLQIGQILEAEPEFRIPERWGTAGYVPHFLAGVHLSACAPTVKEVCVTNGFSKDRLARWRRELFDAAYDARCAARAREKEADEAARREDDAALAGLADLGGL